MPIFASRRNNMHSIVRSNRQLLFECLQSGLPVFTLLGSSDVSENRFMVTLLNIHHSEPTREYLCPTSHSSYHLLGPAKWSDVYA
jgi:hypothetical protein